MLLHNLQPAASSSSRDHGVRLPPPPCWGGGLTQRTLILAVYSTARHLAHEKAKAQVLIKKEKRIAFTHTITFVYFVQGIIYFYT
jgi:hypothetical protein